MKVVSSHRGGLIRGWCLFVLILIIIAAVTGWFVARSDGFKDLVAARLTAELGVPVEVADSYVGWPYQLVLRGVGTPEDAIVRMHVREIRLGRTLRNWTLAVRDASVAFMPGVTEGYTNNVSQHMIRIARLRDAGALDIMRVTEDVQSNWRLQLDDLDLFWLSSDGAVDGFVRQVDFLLEPVQLPSEKMYYYRLSYVGTAENAMGSIRDLSWSWLTRGGDHYVELQRSGVTPDVALQP